MQEYQLLFIASRVRRELVAPKRYCRVTIKTVNTESTNRGIIFHEISLRVYKRADYISALLAWAAL